MPCRFRHFAMRQRHTLLLRAADIFAMLRLLFR
jgi:hypothetical protein